MCVYGVIESIIRLISEQGQSSTIIRHVPYVRTITMAMGVVIICACDHVPRYFIS